MGSNAGIGHLRSARAHLSQGQQIIKSNVSVNGTTVGTGGIAGKGTAGNGTGKAEPEIKNPTSVDAKYSRNDNSVKYTKDWGRNDGKWETSKVSFDEKYTNRYGDGTKHVEEYGINVDKNGFKIEQKHDLKGDGYRLRTDESLEYIKDISKIEDESKFKKPDYVNMGVDIANKDIEALNHEGSVWGDEWGGENNKLKVDVLGYETSGTAGIQMENGTLSANATASAEAYAAKATYEGKYGPVDVKGEASVGANASGNAGVEFNPLKGDANVGVGAEAFAGGKAEVEGGVGNDYAGVGGNAGVSYGIGAEFNADVGVKDWKVNAEFDVGATLGLGFDLGVDIELDAKKLTGWIPKTPW